MRAHWKAHWMEPGIFRFGHIESPSTMDLATWWEGLRDSFFHNARGVCELHGEGLARVVSWEKVFIESSTQILIVLSRDAVTMPTSQERHPRTWHHVIGKILGRSEYPALYHSHLPHEP